MSTEGAAISELVVWLRQQVDQARHSAEHAFDQHAFVLAMEAAAKLERAAELIELFAGQVAEVRASSPQQENQ